MSDDPDGDVLTEEDLHALTNASVNLVFAAVDEDIHEQATIIEGVGERYGHHGVWLLCEAPAHAAAVMGDAPDPGNAGVMFIQGDRIVNPEDLPPDDQPYVWAARYLAAHVNGGPAATEALFSAYLHDQPRAVANVAALVHLVGVIGQAKEAGEL